MNRDRYVPYEQQTVDNPNPIARFAHRTRMKKSKRLVEPFLTESATLLDYGCGQGRFLHDLSVMLPANRSQVSLLGYDPFLSSQFDGYRIVSDPNEIPTESVDVLTCLEVCEHLTDSELQEFVDFAARVTAQDGTILVSVPIEMGPVVLAKELSRAVLFRRRPDMTAAELMNSAFRGIPPRRAEDRKSSHRGFDWRALQETLEKTFTCEHLEFSPLPYDNWYGQSQVFMRLKKRPVS